MPSIFYQAERDLRTFVASRIHNEWLATYCQEGRVPLIDIASMLRDEHFADELHPNEEGAQVIAREVFRLLGEAL